MNKRCDSHFRYSCQVHTGAKLLLATSYKHLYPIAKDNSFSKFELDIILVRQRRKI